MTRNRLDVGILAVRTHVRGKALDIADLHRLVGKGYDLVLEPRRADCGHLAGGKLVAQVDSPDRRAAGSLLPGYFDSHLWVAFHHLIFISRF